MRTRFNEKVIDALSALDAGHTFDAFVSQHTQESSIYIVFGAGTSAGAVVVETSHDRTFTGVWANLATVNWAAASRVHHVAITGIFRALRVRISTAIVGGTIDAYAIIAE